MYYDLDNLEHDPQMAKALGNMVVVWAYAEATLVGVLSRITDIHINMAMHGYYRIPTFEARVKFIQALLLEWAPKDFDKQAIKQEITALSRLAGSRNHWVHGVWCCTKDKSETVIFDFRKPPDEPRARQPKSGRRSIADSNDVETHVDAVRQRSKKLADLIRHQAFYDRFP
jgi:hypothetical protein